MTEQEFAPLVVRLFEAFNKGGDLTTIKLEEYFARYGSLPLEVWRAVVARATLLPNGLPYDNQLDKLVNEIEAEHQQRKAREVRGRGQGGSYAQVLEVAAGPTTMRSHYARFWLTIITGEIGGQTPAQVAGSLEEQDWPSDLRSDIDRLNAAADWRSFHATTALPQREQFQPRQKPVQQETLRWDQQ